MADTSSPRRNFLKKAVYVTPAILTMAAVPSFASTGSGGGRRTKRTVVRKRRAKKKVVRKKAKKKVVRKKV